MNYIIVEERDHAALINSVESYIQQGWRLQGGVSVVDDGSTQFTYCQALVREKAVK